jgi:beta-glucosidase
MVSQTRLDESARRILKEQFLLGLYENPYIDSGQAAGTVGQAQFRAKGLDVQRKSIVLLQNQKQSSGKTLPLKTGARIYTIGDVVKANVERYGFTVTDGNYAARQTRPTAVGYDYAFISVTALNSQSITGAYRSNAAATGANPAFVSPITGKVYGADDPSGLDPATAARVGTVSTTRAVFPESTEFRGRRRW